MRARGSGLVRIACWYCAREWLTRISKGMARCPACRTFNHLPGSEKRKGAA